MDAQVFRECSVCKKPILFGQNYFICSVSTCNGQRTGYVFCRMQCFETHLPGARHRDAGALEKTAQREAAKRIIVSQPTATGSTSGSGPLATKSGSTPQEVLVIASRLKEYIDARSGGFNTSQAVMDILSDHLRRVCDAAIEEARREGRKTVMDRDFKFLK